MVAATSSSTNRKPSKNFSKSLKNYDVFISFRGADIRDGFLSHLHQALCQIKIYAFVDENLERGKEISSSLLEKIEESYVSIVVFTENYAYSPWCLDELVKIYECYKNMGQIVVPVFYHVDPSNVQELKGSFGDAIDKHRKECNDCSDRVNGWSRALMEISNLSGWDSQNIKPDSKLVKVIVSHLLKKLNNVIPSDIFKDGLVGIDSRVKDVQSLLCLESSDVRLVGIWGMGGIGKTTIASKVFSQIYSQFPRCCFVADVREKLEKSTKDGLQSEILSRLVDSENLNIGMPIMLSSSIWRRLSQEKVLIILDDVNDLDQIECMVGGRAIYGSGSRIIITSRDKQLLKNVGAKVYEVKGLDNFEAFQLFRLHAFKQNPLKKEYMELSCMAINYAQGIPLALKVLGSSLYGKSIQEWEGELEKLKGSSNKKVQKILRRSYEGLDEKEKDIFLDIACFFKGYDKDRVTNILDGCGFFAKCGLSHLNDKSLVTISKEKKLGMHDLVQQMGKDIVLEEKELGERSRLWNPEDIYKILTKDMGAKRVEGISLDMSQIRFMNINSTAFVNMYNLRLLKLYEKNYFGKNKVLLSEGLEYFPDELRFLHWDQYPLKSLPSKFCLENLVELHMPKSQLKQLWTEDQTLVNLKLIDLHGSVDLMSIPDLSTVPNLEVLLLQRCTSLVEVPLSIQNLNKLARLSLSDCKSLIRLPSCLPMNIAKLHLSGTALKELPSSIGCLSQLLELVDLPSRSLESLPSSIGELKCLRRLDLFCCSNLLRLPDTICNLKSLQKFYLTDCVNLNELPKNFGNLESLEELMAIRCGLKKLPSSMSQLRQLRHLSCLECKGLMLPSLLDLPCLGFVRLSDCHILEFPDSLCSLMSLEELHLGGNDFEMIPSSIKQLGKLKKLDVRDCKRLKYLPDLPSSLDDLCARNCTSLESASTSFLFAALSERDVLGTLDFGNCISLTQCAYSKIMDDTLVTHQDSAGVILLYIAGNEVLQRMVYRNDCGSSVSLTLVRHDLIGLSFCAVIASKGYPHHALFDIRCLATFTNLAGHSRIENFSLFGDEGCEMDFLSENVFLWHDIIFHFSTKDRFSQASFQFFPKCYEHEVMIIKCGVHPIFNQQKRSRNQDDECEVDVKEQPPLKRLKENQELNGLILNFSLCHLYNEDDEKEPPFQRREESKESKCHDLNFSLSLLFTLIICLATSSQAKQHPTHIIFTLMLVSACLNLLSFASSLSLHGFALSL